MKKEKAIRIDDDVIIAGFTALGGVFGYFAHKGKAEEKTPAVLIGSFIGTIIGTVIKKA